MNREISRRTFSAVAAAAVLLRAVGGRAQSPGVGVVRDGLLGFEDSVSWAAVSARWVGQRPLWQGAVRGARSGAELAAQLLRLEGAMGWSAVQDSWRQRRGGWVAEVGSATTPQEVARLLLELEGVTRWSAMRDVWHSRRDGWVSALRGV